MLKAVGSWKDDFYTITPAVADGSVLRPVHVFVGHDEDTSVQVVGFAMTPAEIHGYLASVH